jgi:hypothetical protein
VGTIVHLVATPLTAASLDEELTFIHPEDANLYREWESKAFELQVANHELLGHGSGKLFEERADGTKNFDPEKVVGVGVPWFTSSDFHSRSSILSRARRCGFLSTSGVLVSC